MIEQVRCPAVAIATERSGARRIGHVAVIGGGFSGTLQAIHLLAAGVPRVTLIERRDAAGGGVAYSTANPAHLLNVRTANMSAFPDDSDHFRRWLSGRSSAGPDAFAGRGDYGDYLRELLGGACVAGGDRLDLLCADAVALDRDGDDITVRLAGGAAVRADAAVLAIGNLPPHDPPGIDGAALPSDLYVADPWAGDVARGLAGDDTVLLVGTGLTAVDVLLSLEAEGFAGRVIALSRHGLLPHAHEAVAAGGWAAPALEPLGTGLLRQVRDAAARVGWRAAVDALRPSIQDIWRRADAAGRARFLRHLRPWWDIHRHRLAPPVAAQVTQWRGEGRLKVLAGRIRGAQPAGGGVDLAWRRRGSLHEETIRVRRIVNCTGPQGDLLRSRDPLLRHLLASGRIRPDAQRIGIDVTDRCETIGADGSVDPRLLAVGPLTRGTFWEIVAVPDIRVQAAALAARLATGAR